MASSTPNKALVARAAAILTNAEVKATSIDLNETWAGQLNVQLDFTKGSLTNIILVHYVSMDGTNWYNLSSGTAVLGETITANATRAIQIHITGGWKFYATAVTGTGTLTSSSATITYRYLRRGTQ